MMGAGGYAARVAAAQAEAVARGQANGQILPWPPEKLAFYPLLQSPVKNAVQAATI